MFGWLWGCMALSFKVIVGSMCWIACFLIVIIILGLIVHAIDEFGG